MWFILIRSPKKKRRRTVAKHKKVMSMEVKLLGIKHWSEIGQISRVVALLKQFEEKYELRWNSKEEIVKMIDILEAQKLVVTAEYEIERDRILVLEGRKPRGKVGNGVGVGLGKGI